MQRHRRVVCHVDQVLDLLTDNLPAADRAAQRMRATRRSGLISLDPVLPQAAGPASPHLRTSTPDKPQNSQRQGNTLKARTDEKPDT